MNEPSGAEQQTSEVEQLRARVVELEAELEAAEGQEATVTGEPGRRSAGWAVLSVVLIVLGVVLAPVSVASVWAKATLSDTDRYVATVAPIAQDPGVQKALADKITTVIFERLDIQGITSEALTNLSQLPNVPPRVATVLPGLSVPIANGVQSFTHDQVSKLLASPQFAQLWEQVNRAAHQQVVALLEGKQGGAVSAQGGTITVNLAPIIATVKDRLVAQGFGLASNIPSVDASFTLVQSDSVTKAQSLFGLLNALGFWLPFVVLALLAGGVFAARDRRRALLGASLGVAVAMVLLGAGLAIARLWYVNTTPGNVLTPESAGFVFDTLVRFLRTALRAVAALGIVVALAAFLAGPSTLAMWTRATATNGIGSARGSAEAAGWNPGRVGTWTFEHRRWLWVAVAVLWALVLMLWDQPTGLVVVWTAFVAVLLLALIEFLGRPPGPAPVDAHVDTSVAAPAMAGVPAMGATVAAPAATPKPTNAPKPSSAKGARSAGPTQPLPTSGGDAGGAATGTATGAATGGGAAPTSSQDGNPAPDQPADSTSPSGAD
jgi:hypothetical protein